MQTHMMSLIRDVAILFPAFLAVFTFRGFARAVVARWMGDDTAYNEGYTTLNPLMHVDIAGLGIILLVVFLLGGMFAGDLPRSMLFIPLIFMGVRWSYSVPFEARNFKNVKWGGALTIFAGPLGGFLLALLFLYILRYLPVESMPTGVVVSLISICQTVVDLAIYFGVLELLPIPPFDGGRLLQFLLPYSKQNFIAWLEEHSLFIMLALFFVPVVSDFFFFGIHFLGAMIKFGLQICVI